MAATHFLHWVIRSGISEFVWRQISDIPTDLSYKQSTVCI